MAYSILALLMIVAILSIGFATVTNSYAVNSSTDEKYQDKKKLSPKSYGSKTNICGLSFCADKEG